MLSRKLALRAGPGSKSSICNWLLSASTRLEPSTQRRRRRDFGPVLSTAPIDSPWPFFSGPVPTSSARPCRAATSHTGAAEAEAKALPNNRLTIRLCMALV